MVSLLNYHKCINISSLISCANGKGRLYLMNLKTNKYPLKNRSKAFFCEPFSLSLFLFLFLFLYRKAENISKQFVIEAVHGSYRHLLNDLRSGQTQPASDIVYEKKKSQEQRVIGKCNSHHHLICPEKR